MTEQFIKTHTLTKSKREELDNYLTYSPRTNKRRGFYTTYQSAGGKQTLERFVDESAMNSVDKYTAPHKEEIRKMLGEVR